MHNNICSDMPRVMKNDPAPACFDTGTFDSLMQASQFVEVIQGRQGRQGLKISCIEEIAYRKGFIDKEQLCKLAEPIRKSEYGEYLLRVVEER
jgi:glucose-1-phosphate thymidylyltransferase